MPENDPPDTDTKPADNKTFGLVVSILVVAIVGMMAFLWYRERRLRLEAEQLPPVGLGPLPSGARPVDPQLARMLARAATQPVSLGLQYIVKSDGTFNGRPCKFVRITPDAGKRLGLKPGELVFVVPDPATKPAAPAPKSKSKTPPPAPPKGVQ